MPDANPKFEKIPRPDSIQTFCTYVLGNSHVHTIQQIADVIFKVEKTNGNSIIVFLTNIYTVSIADIMEILSNASTINAIVTVSAWNGYTSEAKEYSELQKVGLFTFKEFMGAINYDGTRFIKYRVKEKDRR